MLEFDGLGRLEINVSFFRVFCLQVYLLLFAEEFPDVGSRECKPLLNPVTKVIENVLVVFCLLEEAHELLLLLVSFA